MADVNLDPAQLFLQFYRNLLDDGELNLYQAYEYIKDNFPVLFEYVRSRALTIGPVPTVQVGDEFTYRLELILVGLHTHPVYGICIGFDEFDIPVCTCAVAKYPLHNYEIADNLFIYGGEGGRIREANAIQIRILEDQDWTDGNVALLDSDLFGEPVRTVIRRRREEDGALMYVYEGLFTVLNSDVQITPI